MKIIIKVKTKAKEEKIIKKGENNFEIWVKQVPEKGKANIVVVKLLADYFKVSQDNLRIIRGKTSRIKTIILS